MHEGLHPKSAVDRLHIPREDGGRVLIAIEDCVELAVRCLKLYVHGSEKRIIQAASGDRLGGLEASVLRKANKEKRLLDWEKKALHN